MGGLLFPESSPDRDAPLAERMRPRAIDEVVGQEALLGADGFLRRVLEHRRLPSLLLWGPPGSGKTTLARLLAGQVGSDFFSLSAVQSGVKEVRELVAEARRRRRGGRRSVLFIDEIHRFHRGQQDALLPHVEDGTITLIGATTENPAHTVVAPLISRCRVLVLQPLDSAALRQLLERALGDKERGVAASATAEVLEAIAHEADGDARRALTILELAAGDAGEGGAIDLTMLRRAAQQRLLRADRQQDQHYDLASAFIKSLRGSDPDAAIYYLMRMIESGEDPLFPARRMLIFAAEDIGLADPQALSIALAAAQAFERLGLPEGSLPLAEAALYLALAPKSNSVIEARNGAVAELRHSGSLPIPDSLRDTGSGLSKQLGAGKGYLYPHDFPGHYVEADYLPEPIRERRFYRPSDQGQESALAARLRRPPAPGDRG